MFAAGRAAAREGGRRHCPFLALLLPFKQKTDAFARCGAAPVSATRPPPPPPPLPGRARRQADSEGMRCRWIRQGCVISFEWSVRDARWRDAIGTEPTPRGTEEMMQPCLIYLHLISLVACMSPLGPTPGSRGLVSVRWRQPSGRPPCCWHSLFS